MTAWTLDHEEDFGRASGLNREFWDIETGFIRNRESQYYAFSNVQVGDGMLSLVSRQEGVPNAAYVAGSTSMRTSRRQSKYTSGAIVSRKQMLFGRIEVVARSPSGAGVWPAIWLLHEGAGQYGEIDIFEAVGKHPDLTFATIHYGRNAATRKRVSANRNIPGFEGTWHVHTLEWTPDQIKISVDGEPLIMLDLAAAAASVSEPLRQPMRLRINLALGGTWGGRIDDRALPAQFDIASIRIWRYDPAAVAAVPPVEIKVSPVSSPTGVASGPVMRWGR